MGMWQRWCLKLPIIPDLREITIKVDFSPIFAPTTISAHSFVHFSNEPGTQEGKIARHESRARLSGKETHSLKHTLYRAFSTSFPSREWPQLSRCNTRKQFSGSTICTCNNFYSDVLASNPVPSQLFFNFEFNQGLEAGLAKKVLCD